MLGIPATMSPSGRNCLTAKVEVQLPVLWFAKLPSENCIIYIYALMSVKICENTGKPNHVLQPDFPWLKLKSIILLAYVLVMSLQQMLRHPESKCHETLRRLAGHQKHLPKSPCFLSTGHAIIQTTYCNPIASAAGGLSSTMAASGTYIVGFEFSMQSTGQPTW